MDPNTLLNIAIAPLRNSKHWKASVITWGDFLEWLKRPASQKDCGNYVFGELGPCPCSKEHCGCTARDCGHLTRGKATIFSRSGITLDADHPMPGLIDRLLLTMANACAAHTTYSSSPDAPRYRFVFPTDRDMTPEEYFMSAQVLMKRLGMESFDPGSAQPERYMFRPSTQSPGWYQHWVIDGPPISVDALVAAFDPDDYPASIPKAHHIKRNPFELAGAAGAFNRVYADLDDVIRVYELPYSKVSDTRYQFAEASSQAGMGPIAGAEGLFFSHHITDPAGGQTVSAFDLVRLHRFSVLDNNTPDTTPINRLPSHEAMLELATQDPRITAELVGMDFDQDLDPDMQTDWRLQLRMSPRTGRLVDDVANWDLIRRYEDAFRGLYFNEMTLAIEITEDLPWRPFTQGEVFTANDRAALAYHIEREYRFRPNRQLVEDLVTMSAMSRWVNPIKSYLLGLQWDGAARVETCLPGVRAIPYSRMVARKVLVAAVARMLDPGCKWDHTLVLYGLEGLGKSYWVEKLARGWSSNLGRIGDKDTLLTMQRSWIMVSDEGHSLRRAESETQKEFLTRTTDVFRMPYEKETVAHKRHCVIWGSTNDEVFLRRQEGNRRFLIVHCEDAVDFDVLTDEYIDQLWAEAVAMYKAGEQLYLTRKETDLAVIHRERYVEEDALAGLIQEYLDMPIPDDWDFMSPDSRVVWRMNYADGLVAAGTNKMTRVCSTQIWVEAMGRRVGDAHRSDLLEVNASLKRIPGWAALPSRHRINHYGPQLVFQRDKEDII